MVTKEEVLHVAKLAKLEFNDEELDTLTTELNSVIGYVDQLKEVNVDNVQPLENLNEAMEENALRSDVERSSLDVAAALKNAPKSGDNYFLVPKVLQQEVKQYVEQDIVGDEEEELL
ncbi:MAG TPA: Asp-tRNA(Asn)/Glu-tRNA(Gln) amidotransferase subunit GatC [Candidatus Kapabacteria bacterium]|jgi:aspartyl-tRNA(Asn)/glutamyl-tRNA(Gln) amidotransferase subunit C|nr:Asp-tRNA(Asn)/Glu-tRNA(Gln) amidotransferase subunit GatC [Candidatus Kapabacteria bacterium]